MDSGEEKMTACGRELFRLRTGQGLTLGEVARRAGCSTPYLSNVSYGRKDLTPRVAEQLDKVLGTPGTFAAYAALPAGDDVRRRGGARTGPEELTRSNVVPVIAALGAVLPGYVAADALSGSVMLVSPLSRHIPVVEQACEIARGQDRKTVLEFAARFLEFCGWACQDAGDLECAMRWTSSALDYALELQDGPTVAYTLMRKSAIATEAGKPGHGAGLADAGLAQPGPLTPRLKAVLLRQRAYAAASLHDADGALRAAEAAVAEAVAGMSQGVADRAPYCSPQYAAMEAGAVRLRLGQPAAALAVLEQSQSAWPDRSQARDRALCLTRLAAACAVAGDRERAVDAAASAREAAAGVASRRVSDRLSALERKLSAWNRSPGAS
jgi:transcriptional regulator with XRE-family HTH domain/tetratricopeptide (TPR) repeat protein